MKLGFLVITLQQLELCNEVLDPVRVLFKKMSRDFEQCG